MTVTASNSYSSWSLPAAAVTITVDGYHSLWSYACRPWP